MKRIPLPDVAISRDQVVVILVAFDGNGIGRYLWGSCSVANCHRQIGLYAEFIPETFFEEGLKGQGASLYNQRLDAMGMKAVEIQGMLMVDNQPLGIRATPLSDIQLRVVALVCDSSHQNGVLLSTKFMGEHLGEVRGDLRGLEMVIDKSVGRLRPFQDDIRPMLSMECEETAVQGLTLCFAHTNLYLDACFLEFLDASSLHLGKLIDAANDHTPDPFLDDQVGTGRCLAIVGARLQRDVHRGSRQQGLVLWAYGSEGIHFGMTFATTHVVPLADDPAVGTHYHCPHHRIRLRILLAVLGQLDTAAHEFFVFCHIVDECLLFNVYCL